MPVPQGVVGALHKDVEGVGILSTHGRAGAEASWPPTVDHELAGG